mmetsp:Transcript_31170/g.89962  ORF Transcript_31170/g.89962 Transcript_31170/m.89962 type:complete len:388 (-) Transcript_31170:46-1209(-)
MPLSQTRCATPHWGQSYKRPCWVGMGGMRAAVRAPNDDTCANHTCHVKDCTIEGLHNRGTIQHCQQRRSRKDVLRSLPTLILPEKLLLQTSRKRFILVLLEPSCWGGWRTRCLGWCCRGRCRCRRRGAAAAQEPARVAPPGARLDGRRRATEGAAGAAKGLEAAVVAAALSAGRLRIIICRFGAADGSRHRRPQPVPSVADALSSGNCSPADLLSSNRSDLAYASAHALLLSPALRRRRRRRGGEGPAAGGLVRRAEAAAAPVLLTGGPDARVVLASLADVVAGGLREVAGLVRGRRARAAADDGAADGAADGANGAEDGAHQHGPSHRAAQGACDTPHGVVSAAILHRLRDLPAAAPTDLDLPLPIDLLVHGLERHRSVERGPSHG